ncbi:MAG: undecaprenyl diphosphate synthase family protein [Lachnospiraceae bacterium]|nr:undecaprenyl diphosphate synthase family protein [Lachnospiraceae bacterium]
MRIPRHVGIIPDGNRRWAKANGMKKEEGYDYGLLPGLRLLREARRCGIEEITYYGFTVDNCKRPKEQLIAFSKACVDAVKMIENEGVSLLVIGDTKSACFPAELLPYTHRSEEKGKIKVNFLVNYGWMWDLQNGFRSKDISRIDMIIRWGGMCRLSGFLPIQSVYSDIYIIKDLWPDFQEEQLKDALDWYQTQDVTLGG